MQPQDLGLSVLAHLAEHLFDHGHPAARQHGAPAVLQDADRGRRG